MQSIDYIEFIGNAFEVFHDTQERFRTHFQIDEYSNWFYDQVTELLTLSTDNTEINFKYIPIGTYSTNTETWLWAWHNSDSIEKSKDQTFRIKAFGVEKGYDKLTEGYFKSDEYAGWEFIAIAHQILGGIGGYRVESEHLEKYMLVMEQIDNDVAAKIKEQTITCERHGANRMAFICQHLNTETQTGFEEAFPSYKGMELEEDDDLQAWCDQCELERLRTDGWNDESMEFAGIKLVCEDCYFEIKEFNLTK